MDSCYRWGINEGRVSVLDTYVYLLSHYNETLPYDSQEFDVEFSVYPHLQVCYSHSYRYVTGIRYVTGMIQVSCRYVTGMLQVCYRVILQVCYRYKPI